MKRRRFMLGCYKEEEEDVENNINMAGVLMQLLSHSSSSSSSSSSGSRVFECRTCSRQFQSFQALGGHRASHKKPRHVPAAGHGQRSVDKPRAHECSICGLEFSVGQALGGHMRRHRAEAGVVDAVGGGKKRVWLDLNLPPPPPPPPPAPAEDETDCRKMGFALEIADPIPMVDCLY